jgi:hypothetical protein
MKKIVILLALFGLASCSSYQRDSGAPATEEGSFGSEGSSRQMEDLEQSGEDTDRNATRKEIDGSFGGSGGTAPGGAVGPR